MVIVGDDMLLKIWIFMGYLIDFLFGYCFCVKGIVIGFCVFLGLRKSGIFV